MEDPPAVIVMTAFGAVASAVDAMRAGAAEYLTKPINFDELLVVVQKVADELRAPPRGDAACAHARPRSRRGARQHDRIEPADAAAGCSEIVDQVAPSRATVLITGESGQSAQEASSRTRSTSAPREPRDPSSSCTAPRACREPPRERALRAREGLVHGCHRAQGWSVLCSPTAASLFLDEIGEISSSAAGQAAAGPSGARVRARRRYADDPRRRARDRRDEPRPARGGRVRAVSARILFYRLNVVNIETPPLR